MMDTQNGRRRTAQRLDAATVCVELGDQLPGRLGGLVRCLGHAIQEEREPALPRSRLLHGLQQLVVQAAVLLQVKAEIEHRRTQDALLAQQQQRDQQSAKPPVAVEERVDRLELDVDQAGLDQGGQAIGRVVDEQLELAHALLDDVRRRDERRVAGPGAAYPVLAAAEFAGILLLPAAGTQEDAVNSPQQPQAQGRTALQPVQAMIYRGGIVGDLADVVQRHARRILCLELQQFRKRGLRALDLRREQCLLADIHVDQQRWVRQNRCDPVEATQGLVRALQGLQQPCKVERRVRRKWRRQKGPDNLVTQALWVETASARGGSGRCFHAEAFLSTTA